MTGSIFSEGVKVQDMKIRPLTFYLVTYPKEVSICGAYGSIISIYLSGCASF
jgi:hypothetical protein